MQLTLLTKEVIISDVPPQALNHDDLEIDRFVERLAQTAHLSRDHYWELSEHYRLIESIRRAPARGAIVLSRLAAHEDDQVRAHAALAAAHLAMDQPLVASDIWLQLRSEQEPVHAAVQRGITLATVFGYLTADEGNLIRHGPAGLRDALDEKGQT